MAIVLDPTATRRVDNQDPGPDFGDVNGRVIGFRVDTLWRAWDIVVGVWAKKLQDMGATIIYWRTHQGRTGSEGARLAAEEKEFMAKADMVVSGLGNCGSCTGWTIRDAIVAREKGKPAIAVMTQSFEVLSESIAQRAGHSALRRYILPHPLNEMSQEVIEKVARDNFDGFLAAVGAKTHASLKKSA